MAALALIKGHLLSLLELRSTDVLYLEHDYEDDGPGATGFRWYTNEDLRKWRSGVIWIVAGSFLIAMNWLADKGVNGRDERVKIIGANMRKPLFDGYRFMSGDIIIVHATAMTASPRTGISSNVMQQIRACEAKSFPGRPTVIPSHLLP